MEKNQVKKLVITDHGDSSVGIFPCSWEIDVPIYIPDYKEMSNSNKEDLEFFRKGMIEVYKEFCDGRISAEFDYEFKQMEEN